MKYIRQFGIILMVSFLAEGLRALLPLPIPASIYGLALMFLALKTHMIPLHAVQQTGNFLIEIMPLMFIPAAVGLLETWGSLKESWLPVLGIVLLSTVVVMAVSGKTTEAVLRLQERRQK